MRRGGIYPLLVVHRRFRRVGEFCPEAPLDVEEDARRKAY